jgi:hypothetical protein
LAFCSPPLKKNEADSPKRGFGFASFKWFTSDRDDVDRDDVDNIRDSHTHGNEGDIVDSHQIGMGDIHLDGMGDIHQLGMGGIHRVGMVVADGRAYVFDIAAKTDQTRVPPLIDFPVSCFYSLLF